MMCKTYAKTAHPQGGVSSSIKAGPKDFLAALWLPVLNFSGASRSLI